MSDTKKQHVRTNIKDDALRAINRINAIVSDDLWEELDHFTSSHGGAEVADLHETLQTEVDLLLLKMFRSFYKTNSSLILRSAPEAVRVLALTRLKITVLKLEDIVKNTQTLNRSSAMLFFYLFSDSPDTLQAVFLKEMTENIF